VSFVVKIDAEAGTAKTEIAAVEAGLNKATAAAARAQQGTEQARDSLGRYAKAGTDAGEAVAKGSDKAAAAQGKAKKAAEDHGDAITNLIHIAEAYFAVHQFEALIDGYVETRNRINAVAESHQNLNGLMDATFAVAQHTRSAWEDVASTYQRLGTVTKGLGLSQQSVIDLTEEMAMAAKVGGATNREAGASMSELTHAFATGTLQGREFRVLMRDTPSLMHELAVASGKTGAEFAEMGKKSQITASMIVDWFGKAAPAIREKFGQTLPTIAEGFQLIKNAAEKFFGEAAVGGGVVQRLGEALRFVAEHFDTIGKTALAVGEALIGLFVIEKLIVLVKALTVAIAANPLGLLLTGLVVGVSLLRQFGDSLATNQKVWSNVDNTFVTIGDSLRALWEQFKTLGAEIMTFVSEAWAALTGAVSKGIDSKGIGDSLSDVLRLVSGFVGGVRGLFRLMGEDSNKVWAMMAYDLVDVMTKALNGLMTLFGKLFSTLRHELFNMLNFEAHQKQLADAAADARQEVYVEDNKSKLALDPADRRSNNTRLYDKVKEDLEYGRFATNSDDTRHYATRADVDAEFKRRLDMRYNASLVNEYAQRGLDEQGNDLREGRTKIGHINNPLEGTDVAVTAKGAMAEIGTFATKAMDDFDRAARDIAARRVMDAKNAPANYVSDVGGKADAKLVDEKATKALEKLRNEWRQIVEQSNPIAAAEEKFAHGQEVATKAVRAGVTTQSEANEVMSEYARRIEDTLHPHEAYVRKQLEATAALRDTAEEADRVAKMTAYLETMREKGLSPTAAMIAQEREVLATGQARSEQMRAEQGFTAAIMGPQHAYQVQLEALGDLLERSRITSQQYGVAVDGVRAAYLAAVPAGKTFAGGMELAWLKAKADAEAFGTTLGTTLVGEVDKLNDAIVSAANGGQVAWGQMVDAMIQDLERLMIKQLEVAAINAILSYATGGATTGLPIGQAVAGGGVPGVDAPVTLPSQVASIGPGAYPTASTVAVPRPPITTTAAPSIVQVHNHFDTSVTHAAMASKEGQQIILNVIRANQPAVRR